jgi:hypothetical protein
LSPNEQLQRRYGMLISGRERVHLALPHADTDPSAQLSGVAAAEAMKRQVEQELPQEPTVPAVSPDDARRFVAEAFDDSVDPEAQQYHEPDSTPQTEIMNLDQEDNLREHRQYIDSLYPDETEESQ